MGPLSCSRACGHAGNGTSEPWGRRLLARPGEALTPSGPSALEPPRELPVWEPKGIQRQNPALGRGKLPVADTGAESRGKGVVGPSHPKARFVPKGLGLEKGGGGGGSRVSWGDRRGRRGSCAPGGRHAGGGRKGCQEK